MLRTNKKNDIVYGRLAYYGVFWVKDVRDMEKYIDIHSHILPGVDDGARTIEETCKMLQIAYDEGIRVIIATPHHHKRRGMATPEQLKKQLALVRKEAKKISDDFRVYLGAEVFFGHDVAEELKNNEIATINGSDYVMLEFSPGDDFGYIQNAVRKIQMTGYQVIIAHAERYQCLLKDLELLEHLTKMGAYIQINAASIVGNSGWGIKRAVAKMLKQELVHFVGTDTHDAEHRPPAIAKAAAHIKKKYGDSYADRILGKNALKVLKNELV